MDVLIVIKRCLRVMKLMIELHHGNLKVAKFMMELHYKSSKGGEASVEVSLHGLLHWYKPFSGFTKELVSCNIR